MKINLLHNKIIADTITEEFTASVTAGLIPLIEEKFGSADELQMYEDYIADNFEREGFWYYPMTVVKGESLITAWIKWDVSDKSLFKDGIPYAYVGEGELEFSLAEPDPELEDAIEGRSTYFSGDALKLTVGTSARAPELFLCGKYSQSFIDEMARQLTSEIAGAMSVAGLAGSNIELQLIFAPDTFMEHTCENVTYRRLLITDKGCSARDFWIKWTRNDSAVAYSISDHAHGADIVFELGEDVPQKIREKEYRFLVRANTDKYHFSMGRKNITEWRELIKRAVRRGDLEKVIPKIELAEHSSEVHDKLSDILSRYGVPTSAPETDIVADNSDEMDIALEMADKALKAECSESEFEPIISDAEIAEEPEDKEPEEVDFSPEQASVAQDLFAVIDDEDISCEPEDGNSVEWSAVLTNELDIESVNETAEDKPEEEEQREDEEQRDDAAYLEIQEPAAPEPQRIERVVKTIEVPVTVDEERIRAEIEAKLRLEYETAARRRAEEEALAAKAARDREREEHERLIHEHTLLMRENDKLVREREALELQKAAEIQRRKEEEQKLRAEIEARLKAEHRERERLEEAANIAVENQRRAAQERLEAEKRRIEEEQMAEEALERATENAKIEAQRMAEAERIRYETELARGNIQEEAPIEPSIPESVIPEEYVYTSKSVRLMFRTLVDPNIVKRIYEICEAVIKHHGKEKVRIRAKATTPDERTVVLDFLEIPEQETSLLVDMVNVLGKSNLGIVKAIIK